MTTDTLTPYLVNRLASQLAEAATRYAAPLADAEGMLPHALRAAIFMNLDDLNARAAHATELVEVAIKHLPGTTDSDAPLAVLVALRDFLWKDIGTLGQLSGRVVCVLKAQAVENQLQAGAHGGFQASAQTVGACI